MLIRMVNRFIVQITVYRAKLASEGQIFVRDNGLYAGGP